jgi:Flp pilus assembly protein TadD
MYKESNNTTKRPQLLACVLTGIMLGASACANSNSNHTSVKEQVRIGERFLTSGQYDRAYKLLDTIAENNPSSTVAVLALGDAYFRQGAFLKASASYQKAIDLRARQEGWLGLGKVELARNNPDAALSKFQKVLAQKQNDVEALNGMGIAYDISGRHDVAQAFYKRVLALAPSNKQAHNNLSLSLALNGKPLVALARIAELSRSNLSDKTIRQNLAIIQYMSGYAKQALRTAMLDLTESQAQQNFKTLPTHMGNRNR